MKYFNIIFLIISLLILHSNRLPPHQYSYIGLLSFLIPLIIACNFIILIFWLRKLSYHAILPFVALLFGIRFMLATVAFNFKDREAMPEDITLLSYNVRGFNANTEGHDNRIEASKAMIDWVVENDADIKCFQEFYSHQSLDRLKTIEKIAREGVYDYHISYAGDEHKNARLIKGIAIFSKYPIIEHGEIDLKSFFPINKGTYADIDINGDTIRVISVHLSSMSIKERNLLKKEFDEVKQNYKDVASRLHTGIRTRSRQIVEVERIIQESPYKVILCGDLNELPYGYTYYRFRKTLKNAFEEAGKGFGFTYNGMLFFLRIDHIFYDPAIEATQYTTFRKVKYSDHFPIQGTFSLKK